MQKPKVECVRQGDLVFVPVASKEKHSIDISSDLSRKRNGFRDDGIIQEGEATGHHHYVDPTQARVFRPAFGRPFVIVNDAGPVNVLHGGTTRKGERFHGPQRLEAGITYDVHIDREFDPVVGERRVTD